MPIDQTMRGLALEIDASIDPTPQTHPLLEYRFIDLASTQTILARIIGIPQPQGGGQLAFETNAGAGTTTTRMLIDNSGNVGIGTENPGARLDVAGDANFKGPLNVQGPLTVSGIVKIGGELSVTGPLDVQGALTASDLNVGGSAKISGDLTVAGKLKAASFAGNGAGLSNLTLANGSVTNAKLADGSVTNAKLAQDPAALSKVTGGTMVISADNVGIGTASKPQNRLHVGPGTSSIVPSRVNAVVASNTPDAGIAIAQNSGVNVLLQASGAGGYLGTTSNHPIVFRTGDRDRMSVDTKGKVTVTGITQTQKLQLGNKWLLSGEGDAHANDDWLRLFDIQGAGYFGGLAAGKLYSIGGTVHGSDLRLKTDVSSLDRMVDKILALRGVRFKWRSARDTDSYRIGLIAQEVERVLPEVIETGPDGMKGINEAGLVAAIITAIKEQQAELSALRTEFELFQRP
jgi:Chaperone of endosialidase